SGPKRPLGTRPLEPAQSNPPLLARAPNRPGHEPRPGYAGTMKQLKFEIDKETMRGRPTNGALIAHTADEFLFDFVLVMPGQQPVVSARLVTSPRHAKALLRSLEDNIKRFEARYGQIPEPKRPIQPGQVVPGTEDEGPN